MSIVVEELSYTYMQNTSSAFNALRNVSFTVNDGEFVGIIGHTGSGKSTLIQQLNGLMHPTIGRVIVDGYDMNDKKQRVKGRALIGMVFQYPDYQLFDSTVLADVSFGPRNLGLSEEDTKVSEFVNSKRHYFQWEEGDMRIIRDSQRNITIEIEKNKRSSLLYHELLWR